MPGPPNSIINIWLIDTNVSIDSQATAILHLSVDHSLA